MNDVAAKVLASTRYATISTVDNSGRPWAAPVWYISDNDLNIYWWSPIESQHSKNIAQNSEVYITIFDSSAVEGEGLGLYIRAKATQVDDTQLDTLIDNYNQTTHLFKLSRANCTGDAPTRLYQATPITVWNNNGQTDQTFYTDIREELQL